MNPQEYQISRGSRKCVCQILPYLRCRWTAHDVMTLFFMITFDGHWTCTFLLTFSAPSLWYCVLRVNVKPRWRKKLREQVRRLTSLLFACCSLFEDLIKGPALVNVV